jgi:hypothetical protein
LQRHAGLDGGCEREGERGRREQNVGENIRRTQEKGGRRKRESVVSLNRGKVYVGLKGVNY